MEEINVLEVVFFKKELVYIFLAISILIVLFNPSLTILQNEAMPKTTNPTF